MATSEQFSPEAILVGLAEHPEATAAELAEAVGIGKSTATRYLAALETEGKARRTPGGWSEGRRFADRWSVTPAEAEIAAGGISAPSVPPREGSAERLAPGALGPLVLAYLAAHPGDSFGPAAVGKALGRSGGAVSNALAAMAVRGEVKEVTNKPRRYRIVVRK
jgi:DNA-binding MarR family transcriptional regulator